MSALTFFSLAIAVGLTVAVMTDARSDTSAIPVALTLLWVVPLCVAMVRYAFFVRVTADDAGVTVVNYARTKRYEWSEIDRFEVGWAYWGATLVPYRGAPVKMNAIQKTNLYHWLGKRGRADDAVDALNSMLLLRQIPPRPDRTHVA